MDYFILKNDNRNSYRGKQKFFCLLSSVIQGHPRDESFTNQFERSGSNLRISLL